MSPANGIAKAKTETSRDRVLSKDELTAVYNATFQMPYPFGPLFRILIFTAQMLSEVARELYLEYQIRPKNELSFISNRFADVVAYFIVDVHKQLDAELGKKSFRDCIIALNRYLIPYFGDDFITSIDYEELQRFARWRADEMEFEPMASTLNTHNSALNRVFGEAVVSAYMSRSHVPVLISKGSDSTRRPDFSVDDCRKLIRALPSWIDNGRELHRQQGIKLHGLLQALNVSFCTLRVLYLKAN